MKPILNIQNLSKKYDGEQVLKGVSLQLERGQVLSLLGASGSGKTTLLKIVAGLETADEGQIFSEGDEITLQKPQQRNMVYLYQEALLFPHLKVFENIAFGLRIRKISPQVVKEKVTDLLQLTGLEEHADKLPEQLSGGQKQRVAFARAVIIEPKVLLLDEPFGALDAHTRQKMQSLFLTMTKKLGLTALFVTHDLKEAILMGDQIGKIDQGQLKMYPDKAAFFDDAASGVREEINFWKGISKT